MLTLCVPSGHIQSLIDLNTVPTQAVLKEGHEGLETKTTFECTLQEVLYMLIRRFLPSSLFFGEF